MVNKAAIGNEFELIGKIEEWSGGSINQSGLEIFKSITSIELILSRN